MLFLACQSDNTLFHSVPSHHSGITFNNTIEENDTLNVVDHPYVYNGGGVGVGDVNNDGLDDIFFAGNQVSCALYLNQGDLKFLDVTETAGVRTSRWATGVAMIDINQDGWLDIYVCVANKFNAHLSRNYLFINQGSNTPGGTVSFVDQAETYHLADDGYSTQAAFFDYDRDGDLDMYLLTNGLEEASQNVARTKRTDGESLNNDRIYRNDTPPGASAMTFNNVTREAGILTEGYGLGVAINDFNHDGWPDVYAANDFIANDLLWINNGDGTFTDRAADYLKHQTHNGMGIDAADFNNDALVDIVVLDMLPEDNFRQKMMFSKPNEDRFRLNTRFGYTPQYVRNTLQLHNGFTPDGQPSFSEIGQLAGISNTDWSWSALLADLNNDGHRDLLVTNGYAKDVTDLDYTSYRASATQFGTSDAKRAKSLELTKLLKEAKVSNYAFRNEGNLTFTDVSSAWGVDEPSFSNGTAFADLDQDGDLDLVMNNINNEAFLYENTLTKDASSNYLRIDLKGPPGNRRGLQTTIRIKYQGQQQYHYHSVYRGYKTTVENTIHFGLGKSTVVDSLEIIWPDRSYQLLTDVAANQVYTANYQHALDSMSLPRLLPTPLLTDVSDSLSVRYRHRDEDFVDFKYEPLLPRSYAQDGPCLATGDINSDGRIDFYVGGAKNQAGQLFVQRASGQFDTHPLPGDSLYEDTGAVLFDADGDGSLDLYVVSGGNEYSAGHLAYRDRLYRNDGKGKFVLDTAALPPTTASGSCVISADYDQDGDLDLLVGSRLINRQYPLPASSYLLRNNGGVFTDVTAEVAPALIDVGLVTDALWTDFDQDQQIDLLVVGEWMAPVFLRNEDGIFVDVTASTGLSNASGWWNTLATDDFDGDGDPDYIIGNLGFNTQYRGTDDQPLRVYAKDFDGDGRLDPLITRYIMGKEYPVAFRDAFTDQMNRMRGRFPNYESYARSAWVDLFTAEEQAGAYRREARRLATSYVENQGDGTFIIRDMPMAAQTAPVYGIATGDINGDGFSDALLVGNSYAPDVYHGRYDAFIGEALLGDGNGSFNTLPLAKSGFHVDSDATNIAVINHQDTPLWVITNNNDSLALFKKNVSRSR